MRTTLLVAAALIAVSARAESPKMVKGFLGVPWGATSIEADGLFAQRSLDKRAGVVLDPDKSNDDDLVFSGGKFAGLEVNEFTLRCVNGRFWRADVRLVKKSEGHEAEFLALKKLFVEKYGQPDQPDPNGTRRTFDWHVKDSATGHEVHVCLTADPRGTGAWIVYACDRIRDEILAAAPKQKPGEVATPIVLPEDAKDDL